MEANFMKDNKKANSRPPMRNITINIPDLFDKNIKFLMTKKIVASRSDAVRRALKEFLDREYGSNLDLLGFFDIEEEIQ